jgi:hypothetical protein
MNGLFLQYLETFIQTEGRYNLKDKDEFSRIPVHRVKYGFNHTGSLSCGYTTAPVIPGLAFMREKFPTGRLSFHNPDSRITVRTFFDSPEE